MSTPMIQLDNDIFDVMIVNENRCLGAFMLSNLYRWIIILVAGVALAATITGCSGATLEEVSETTVTYTYTLEATITEEAYPAPTSIPQGGNAIQAYPQPGGYPYPGFGAPAQVIPTATPIAYPYPGPEQLRMTEQGFGFAYPGPGTPVSHVTDVVNPYPGVGTEIPASTPQPIVIGTSTETPLATPVYEATAIPAFVGVVRTKIEASDPTSFSANAGVVQFVELFAYWSPESISMAPVIHRLEDKYGSQIQFVYLDVDDPRNKVHKEMMGSHLPPFFIMLDREGNVINEWRGYTPIEQLEAVIISGL